MQTKLETPGPKEFIAMMAVLISVVAISIDAMLPALGITLGTIIGQLYNGTLVPIVGGLCILGTIALIIIHFEKSHLTTKEQKTDPIT